MSEQVSEADLAAGSLFPPLDDILKVSWKIAADVALKAKELGLSQASLPNDIHAKIRQHSYNPVY